MALSRPLAALAAASFALVALSTAAFAGGELKSGDERATAHATPHGNNVNTCAEAGLPGKTIASGDVKAEAGDVYIDVLDHTGLTAVVVKGGDAYNVYLADKLSAGWTGLHSPLNPNDKPAGISHWFACGEVGGEQPPTKDVPPTKEQPPATTVTSSAATTPATSVTTTSPNAPAGGDQLASTGFGSAWLVGLGAALLAAGAAVLLVLRRRRA